MAEAKSSNKIFIHYIIGITLMFGFQFIPAAAPLTPFGMNILGIFIGLAYLWSTTDGIWASMLSFVALALSGYAGFGEVLQTALSNRNVLVIFFTLILFGSAVQCGLTKYIAHFFLTRKIIDHRPIIFTFMMIFAAYIVSALTDAIPAVLLFWPIIYDALEDIGCKKRETYSTLLVMGVFFGACLGSAVFPFKGAILIALSAFEGVAGQPVPYFGYTATNFITATVIIILYSLMVKFIFRADLSQVSHVESAVFKARPIEPMNFSQKLHIVIIAAYIVLVMLSSILPETLPGAAFLKSLGADGLALCMLIILLMVRHQGQSIFDFREVVHSGMRWNVYFMVASAVYIAGALKSPDTGILPFLKTVLSPVLGGHSELVFVMILFFFAALVTCFFHNGVLANMLMPIVFAFSSTAGYNGIAIAAVLTMVINVSFLTPAASVYAPLLHTNRDWITFKDVMTYGLAFNVLAILCFIFLGLPLAKILF